MKEKKILEWAKEFKFVQTEAEAQHLHNEYKSKDPFPFIKPALLNSADIADYVAQTGMIFPFYPTEDSLKPASYEMSLGNIVLYWSDKGEKRLKEELTKDDTVILPPNSITYVTVNETFLLPDYIALRFNLSIRHVHRGLLLGTGPMVNPGFKGKLMIPLHNLTLNEYHIRPGDDLISVEFTKLSTNEKWNELENSSDIHLPKPMGKYCKNRMKPGLSFDKFIKKALPHNIDSVRNAIGQAVNEAVAEVEKVKKIFDSTVKVGSWTFVGVIVALLVGFATIYYDSIQLVQSSNELINTNTESNIALASNELTGLNKQLSNLTGEINNLKIIYEKNQENQKNLLNIKENLRSQENSIVEINSMIGSLREEITNIKMTSIKNTKVSEKK